MSLVVGVPFEFEGGFVIASDSASASVGGDAGQIQKLRRIGGAVVSATGALFIRRAGQPIWSLFDRIEHATPTHVRESDLPQIARAVARSWEPTVAITRTPLPEDEVGAFVLFYWPTRVAGFILRVQGHRVVPTCGLGFTVDPNARVRPLCHGVEVDKSIIDAGKLTPTSYATMRRRIGEVTEEQAKALALDVQEKTALAVPDKVSGPFDVEVVTPTKAAAWMAPSWQAARGP